MIYSYYGDAPKGTIFAMLANGEIAMATAFDKATVCNKDSYYKYNNDIYKCISNTVKDAEFNEKKFEKQTRGFMDSNIYIIYMMGLPILINGNKKIRGISEYRIDHTEIREIEIIEASNTSITIFGES